MNTLIFMYITLAPVIIAGVFNMIWCKVPFLKPLRIPIDRGICLKDGKRVFGDNKTWKGFVGYIILNTFFMVLWGLLCEKSSFLFEHNFFYINNENSILLSLKIGALVGLAYALFELPNSFIKRRLSIVEGKSTSGFKQVFFIFLDQADSIFGCVLVVWLFYHDMNLGLYFSYVFVGAITHILINILLYFARLRKNMF